ncbi:unnamed protein product [Camellia sinensis]
MDLEWTHGVAGTQLHGPLGHLFNFLLGCFVEFCAYFVIGFYLELFYFVDCLYPISLDGF